MHIDARTLEGSEQETDPCLIGAGPAGISLACEFLGQALRHAMLDAIDFQPRAWLDHSGWPPAATRRRA